MSWFLAKNITVSRQKYGLVLGKEHNCIKTKVWLWFFCKEHSESNAFSIFNFQFSILMTITLIAGARPNFIKIAPIIHAITKAKDKGHNINYRLVHTGQHYDHAMSGSFFEQLSIPAPHANLGCGGGTQAEQTAAIMVAFEKELMAHPADLVLVVGDVTSTMACAITAKKLNTPVAHVEAGIRSGDLKMPEEINRIVTDSITDHFFTTTLQAGETLTRHGVQPDRIHFVGNVMIDTLLAHRHRFFKPEVWDQLTLKPKEYIVLTLHRPANVDEEEKLRNLISEIIAQSRNLPLIFPVHPRTAAMLSKIGIAHPRLHTTPPRSYLEFNYLVEHARAVITDSGGITEEASIMRIPCMTLRDNTERPETVTLGTNQLLGTNPSASAPAMNKLFANQWQQGSDIPLWDGKAAERIVDRLLEMENGNK